MLRFRPFAIDEDVVEHLIERAQEILAAPDAAICEGFDLGFILEHVLDVGHFAAQATAGNSRKIFALSKRIATQNLCE